MKDLIMIFFYPLVTLVLVLVFGILKHTYISSLIFPRVNSPSASYVTKSYQGRFQSYIYSFILVQNFVSTYGSTVLGESAEPSSDSIGSFWIKKG